MSDERVFHYAEKWRTEEKPPNIERTVEIVFKRTEKYHGIKLSTPIYEGVKSDDGYYNHVWSARVLNDE